MSFAAELQARGIVHQSTADVETILNNTKALYCGFDPTGDKGLHVGSLFPLITMRRFMDNGFTVLGLIGGSTGMIGDPSGKNSERVLMSLEQIAENERIITAQVSNFCSATVNNKDWSKITFIDFIREIGKHFSVNTMLSRDSVKSRLDREGDGISFTEFSYMLIQGFDFLSLNNSHGVNLQIGGSDQWTNILSGIDLIHKKKQETSFGITIPLITKADGTKFGKSESGAIWLDSAHTSDWDFWQFFINTSDELAISLLKKLTFLSIAEINDIEEKHNEAKHLRIAQNKLADAVTAIVRGDNAVIKVRQIADIVFGNINVIFADIDSSLHESLKSILQVTHKGTVIESLIDLGFATSGSNAKQLISSGAVKIDGVKVSNNDKIVSPVFIKKGKNNIGIVIPQ